MNKPKGLSRQDCRNMKEIVRQFLSDPSAMVDVVSEHGETRGYVVAQGYQSCRTEEGYSSTGVEVYLGEKPGTYEVKVYNDGRDCDGRLSNQSEYVVGPAGKRKRFYWSRNWQKNRPEGRFGMKGSFKVLSNGRSSQRDYTAEAAGY